MILPQGIVRLFASLQKEVDSLNSQKVIIAIDGHSSSGKSTLSKDLASLFKMVHVDTGAMYRAVTYYLLQKEVNLSVVSDVERELTNINIDLRIENQHNVTYLNGENVEKAIRSASVSDHVSHVAAMSCVRKFLVRQQRQLAQNRSIVMDGRDIGTVVFPEADVKLFVTASLDVRAERRFQELHAKGMPTGISEVRSNLERRDHIDSTREDSPLMKSEDAQLLDTTYLDRNEMLTEAAKIILTRL